MGSRGFSFCGLIFNGSTVVDEHVEDEDEELGSADGEEDDDDVLQWW